MGTEDRGDLARDAQARGVTDEAGVIALGIEGVWQVGSYLNMSPVLRVQGRVDGPGPSEPYGAVFDEVGAQMHVARMQPGVTIAVFVDPQNSHDMAIDWIPTGQLRGERSDGGDVGPPPPGFPTGSARAGGTPGGVTSGSSPNVGRERRRCVVHPCTNAIGSSVIGASAVLDADTPLGATGGRGNAWYEHALRHRRFRHRDVSRAECGETGRRASGSA